MSFTPRSPHTVRRNAMLVSMAGNRFVDTYHVDAFQELGLCPSGVAAESAIVGEWSEVLKHEDQVNCGACQTLIALVKANRLEIEFDKSYSDSPFDDAYAGDCVDTPILKQKLLELLK